VSAVSVITLREGADADRVRRALVGLGLWVSPLQVKGDGRPAQLLVHEYSAEPDPDRLLAIEGVLAIAASASAHPRLDAQAQAIVVAGRRIGRGEPPTWMAGPCSVESETQIGALAGRLAAIGVHFLRGGAFKPRTSPYAFSGHGRQALGWMRRAADEHGLRVVTEAMDTEDLGAVAETADLIQVGSRNMHNYSLLRAVGRTGRPVLLKRGMAATVEEWLQAAEHCLVHGAAGVLLCERGIRGFDASTRNVLDLGTVALLAHVHGLPVIVDPSHGAGRRDLVVPLARAALAAGAAGLLVETHEDPGSALSDGPQALPLEDLRALVGRG
jgi:3-deoxy-7-phosphoheptulonate synthase